MKLKSIDAFFVGEDEEVYPKEITVTMNLEEYWLINKMTYGTSHKDLAEKYGAKAPLAASEIGGCIWGDVINRYWEDGDREDYLR